MEVISVYAKIGIIVAGMHRSGTSAFARVINLLGAEISQNLLPPVPNDNDLGYWESPVVNCIHDDLLASLGAAWDYSYQLPRDWLKRAVAQHAKAQLADEIKKQFGASSLFVVKDPRISRLLPLWLELFNDFEIKPVVVIPFRNPLEVAASLKKRNAPPLPATMLMYLQSYLDLEWASRGRSRLFVYYPQLLDDWRSFAERLAHFVEGRFSARDPTKQIAIDEFLTRDLRHNFNTREELVSRDDISDWIVEIFDRMCEAANAGDEVPLSAAFDHLRETSAAAAKLYEGCIKSDIASAKELANKLHAKENEFASLRRESAEALARSMDQKERELATLKEESAEALARSMDQKERELAALREESAEALARSMDQKERELAALRDESAQALVRLRAEFEAEFAHLQTRMDSVIANLRHEIAALRSSFSWRLTAPIRKISLNFPALRHAGRRILKMD